MFAKALVLVFLASLAVAEIPSYFKICGMRNPNLDKCVLESVESLRDKLREGMPDLDIPPLDPLTMDGFHLLDMPNLKTHANNVKLYGLADFVVKSVHVDLEKQTLAVNTVFNKVIVDADYDVKAKIVVPIESKGPVHIVADHLESTTLMKWKLVKRNGAEYMFFTSMTTKIKIQDYSAEFTPPEGSDSPIAKAINTALESGRQEILEAVRPNLEKLIIQEVLGRANKICSHFTYAELYPDRE